MKPKERIEQLLGLWRLERDAERARDLEERAETTLAQRVELGRALSRVEVSETASASGGRTLLWIELDPDLITDFRASPGAPLLLWHDSPDAPDSLRGVLGRRRRNRLGVMTDDFPDERYLSGHFNIDLESTEVTHERGARALRTLRDAKPASDAGRLTATLFADALEAETLRAKPLHWHDEALNEAQRAAVEQALFTEPLSLIHGPPGTGKTRTLVEVARQLVDAQQSVLVAAASNAAVDNLAERLIAAGVAVVRLGHPARVAPAVEARTLDALLEARPDFALAKGWMEEANRLRRRTQVRSDRGSSNRAERREAYAEARRLMSDARSHLRGIEQAILGSTQVVACTLTGADSALLGDRSFDAVIVDEATQAADPLVAIAATRGRRLILAGDPHQLPPTIISDEANKAGLSTTVFDRFSDAASLLVVQHRMHEQIMEFPSESKYDGELIAHESNARRTLDVADPLRPAVSVFLDTAGKGWVEEEGAKKSTFNPGQAERTVAEVRRLVGRGVAPEDIGVISPYYAQVKLLRGELSELGVEVDTVDGFQGRERDVVVVDLVRSNDRGEIGFLADTRRVNVALTRAKRFLLVIGDSATVGSHPYYADYLANVEANGGWVSAWADDAPPFDDLEGS